MGACWQVPHRWLTRTNSVELRLSQFFVSASKPVKGGHEISGLVLSLEYPDARMRDWI